MKAPAPLRSLITMDQLYTRTLTGSPIFQDGELDQWLRGPAIEDQPLIKSLLSVVTEWGEGHTSLEFRANTWELLQSGVYGRSICLQRAPVSTITSVTYTVEDDDPLTYNGTFAASNYYLKKGTSFSEVLLRPASSWMSDLDHQLEHNVKVIFTTSATQYLDIAKQAVKMHLLYLYENRGDVDVDSAARQSGAWDLYRQITVIRI